MSKLVYITISLLILFSCATDYNKYIKRAIVNNTNYDVNIKVYFADSLGKEIHIEKMSTFSEDLMPEPGATFVSFSNYDGTLYNVDSVLLIFNTEKQIVFTDSSSIFPSIMNETHWNETNPKEYHYEYTYIITDSIYSIAKNIE